MRAIVIPALLFLLAGSAMAEHSPPAFLRDYRALPVVGAIGEGNEHQALRRQ